MHHSNGSTVGGCNNVDFLMKLRCLFCNHHCENRCTCRNVTCTNSYRVSGCHTCTCVALRRCKFNTCLKCAAYVKKLSALLCKIAGALTCVKHTGKNFLKCPRIIFILYKICENFKAIISVVALFATRCLTNSENLIACKLPVDKAGKSSKVCNILNVRYVLKDILIKMGDAPSLRNSRVERLSQLFRGLCGNSISPCSEGSKKIIVLIECKVAVHHTGNTDSADGGKLFAVCILKICTHLCVAILKATDNIVHCVCPDSVNITVFPGVTA